MVYVTEKVSNTLLIEVRNGFIAYILHLSIVFIRSNIDLNTM